ncbi:MAG: thrombospondin type 3 repeat-containing protein [Myxococcota bacterium]
MRKSTLFQALPILLCSLALACEDEPELVVGDAGAEGSTAEGGTEAGPPTDGDGDTISDAQEGPPGLDTDDDGTPDAADADSDGDGISDRDEAGDDDITTPPVDTDGDRIPDFRDLDSDDDGLPDASERENGTNPLSSDSDGDGVTDLVEVVAGTDPLDAAANPRLNGDFFFVVPFMEAPMPPEDTLVFEAEIRKADVYFMIDSSISMQQEIQDLRDSLADSIFPGLTGAIADVQLGVGHFDQCPDNLGPPRDFGIVNAQRSTSDVPSVVAGLDVIVSRIGGGPKEPYGPAAWLFATGDHTFFGNDGAGMPLVAARDCPAGTVGYGCVRPDALPILVIIGDENYREGNACMPGVSTADVTSALNAISSKVIAIGREGPEWNEIATNTGSVDAMGNPFVSRLGSGSIDTGVIDAVQTLADSVPLDLTAEVRDVDEGDGVDATIFVERLVANATGGVADPRDPMRVCAAGLTTVDGDGDGFPDTFQDVTPGTAVCFDVVAQMNDQIMPTDMPQVFRAQVDVLGEGVTVLDTRDVFFLVPPRADTSALL